MVWIFTFTEKNQLYCLLVELMFLTFNFEKYVCIFFSICRSFLCFSSLVEVSQLKYAYWDNYKVNSYCRPFSFPNKARVGGVFFTDGQSILWVISSSVESDGFENLCCECELIFIWSILFRFYTSICFHR